MKPAYPIIGTRRGGLGLPTYLVTLKTGKPADPPMTGCNGG